MERDTVLYQRLFHNKTWGKVTNSSGIAEERAIFVCHPNKNTLEVKRLSITFLLNIYGYFISCKVLSIQFLMPLTPSSPVQIHLSRGKECPSTTHHITWSSPYCLWQTHTWLREGRAARLVLSSVHLSSHMVEQHH